MRKKSRSTGQKTKQNTKKNRIILWIKRHPYWASFIVGFIYFGIVISWMFTLKTAEIAQGFTVQIVAFSAGIIMTSSFALGFVFFTWIYRRLKIDLNSPRALLLIPAAWLVSEFVRAIIFSIVSMGPGGRIGPYWTFGNIGYYLAETPLAFIARFGGLYLLSGIVALLVVASYQSYKRRSIMPIIPILIALCLLSFLGFKLYAKNNGPTVTIAAARYASKDIQGAKIEEPRQLLEALPSNSTDTLVLPEYSEFFAKDKKQDSRAAARVLKRDDGLIIHSTDENTSGLGHNLLTFQDAKGKILNQQQKWFVVPAGEYVPYFYQLVLAYAGKVQLIRDFDNQKSVDRGEASERPYIFNGVSYGSIACSGIIAPDFYNKLARSGADIFTNSASLDTMGISPLFHLESQNMNKLTAMAHAKPFVQSARGGPAYIIDHNGQIVTKSNSPTGKVVTAQAQTNDTKTIYTQLGDWIVYVSIFGLTIYWIYRTRQKRH